MPHYLASRLAQAPIAILVVLIVVFVLARASGDPVDLYLPIEASAEQRQDVRVQLGLDQPVPVQFMTYLGNAIHGDFGTSIRYRRPALEVLSDAVLASATLAVAGMSLAIVAALLLGVAAAVRRGSIVDQLSMAVAVVGQSTPSFWFGILIILLFAVQLHWLPTSGGGDWKHLVMPALTVAFSQFPQLMLLVRSGLIDEQREEYVRTARSKGLAEGYILRRHLIPNVLNPFVTSLGVQFGPLIGGAVITEYIFSWPGVGQLTLAAVFSRDFPIVQAAALFFAISIVGINLLAEAANGILDPRMRRA